MNFEKRIAETFCCVILCASLSAQTQTVTKKSDSSAKTETNVENEYISNVEDVIITELANSDDYDNKIVALQYLKSAVDSGRDSPDITGALDQLASEGVTTQSRTNGRVMNNYPDIRAQACDILAKVQTEDSKNTLVNIALHDNEPMVISAAVRALGDVGINNKDEVVKTIAWAQKKNAVLNPTSSLAFEVLVAYDKLADTVEDKNEMIQSVTAIAANPHYVSPVRAKALDLLKKIQKSARSSSKSTATEK